MNSHYIFVSFLFSKVKSVPSFTALSWILWTHGLRREMFGPGRVFLTKKSGKKIRDTVPLTYGPYLVSYLMDIYFSIHTK